MNEGKRTLTYVGVALVVLIIAIVSQPRAPEMDAAVAQEGEILIPVDDPLKSKSLRIVEFNEDAASLRQFEIDKKNDKYVIPSHQDYPADAERQLGQAATEIMNVPILRVASENRSEHTTYGVVDPEDPDLKPSTRGVGTRVTMTSDGGDTLADVIIGDEVKDAEGQRFVRVAKQDPVYVMKLDPSKFSTKFEDWIEDDLLKLNSFDIREVELKDYSAELGLTQAGLQVLVDQRGEMKLNYNNTDSKWEVVGIKEYNADSQELVDAALAEDEELDDTKLNDLKNALDDLKIVDVERKPEGLTRDLKADANIARNDTAVRDLFTRGFFPFAMDEKNYELLSTDGEVLCQMQDGVQYVLRFGKFVVGSTSGAGEGEEAASETDEAENGEAEEASGEKGEEANSGIHRYVLVTARFNSEYIEKPALEEVPPLPDEATQSGGAGADEGAADEDADRDADGDADGARDNGDAADNGADEDADNGEAASSDSAGGDVTESAGPSDEGDGAGEADGDAQEETPDDVTPDDATPDDETPDKEDRELADLLAQRAEIEKENNRKLDDYNEKIEKGTDRAKELTDRFGPWYYVVADSVYKKIRLGRPDIVKKKETEEEADEEAGPAGT